MENYYCQWENPLFLWSFSIAMLNCQRVISIFTKHSSTITIYHHPSIPPLTCLCKPWVLNYSDHLWRGVQASITAENPMGKSWSNPIGCWWIASLPAQQNPHEIRTCPISAPENVRWIHRCFFRWIPRTKSLKMSPENREFSRSVGGICHVVGVLLRRQLSSLGLAGCCFGATHLPPSHGRGKVWGMHGSLTIVD